MPSPSLVQRLKERKFVQWAVAYLAGAFVVVQLLDVVAEPLALSSVSSFGPSKAARPSIDHHPRTLSP